MDSAVCLGDAICLYSEDHNGFVCAHTNSSSYAGIAVREKDDRVQPQIPDCQTIAIRVWNANRYKLQKVHSKLVEKLRRNPNDMTLKAEVAAAKEAADAEIEDNQTEQKRLRGKRVVYGQVIQLEHKFTGKLLHASSRTTAVTESSNMQIFLSEVNDKTAHFRIMPRYKVKAEGDLIQVDDQIVLESVKSLGQYMHVSRGFFGNLCPIYEKCHELNISVQSSGFTIYRHYKWKESEEDQLKAGMPFRLFHAELEAYMVAEGVFGDEVTEEVHLRVRNQDPNQPRTMVPPTSAISYWQLEINEGVVRGDVVRWQQQVRLKHMCTQRYLAIGKDRQVSLSDDHLDPSAVFQLHPVIRGRDEIEADTFCRISHVVTGLWLGGVEDEYKSMREKRLENEKSSMASLKYSTAVLLQLSVKEEMQYDDAFTIQPVEPVNLANFNFMAGTVPVIQMMIQMASSNSPANSVEEARILATMLEIREFMLVNGEPSKRRQKLLRNLQVVELLVRLLQRPIRGRPRIAFLTKVFLEAYNVLHAYLLGDSRKNELYIARHIDFFKSQIDIEGAIGLNAAYMVTELVRDNRKLVDRIPQSYIDDIIEVLRKRKHERYLKFLEILCVCDGMSIPDNQRYICEKWLMAGDRQCVFHTEVGQAIKKEHNIVYVSLDNRRSWKTLRSFAREYKTALEEEKNRKPAADAGTRQGLWKPRPFRQRGKVPRSSADVIRDFNFLENQLQLFGKLCQGRQEFCIDVITKELGYLTWEEAFLCLSDSDLPDEVRANYCEVIINLFIDVGQQTSVLDNITLTFVYDDIPDRERCLDSGASHVVVDKSLEEHIARIRRWIAGYLDKHKDMTASEEGQNRLIRQVLRLLQFLVRFGYYSRVSDVKTLIGPLLSLTDGRNDKPCPPEMSTGGRAEFTKVKEYYQKHERYRPSSETKAIVDAKLEAMGVLGLLFNFRFNSRLLRFISEFKFVHASAQQMSGHSELAPLLLDTYEMSSQPSTNARARRVLEEIYIESDYFANTELIDIVLDLSHYEYDNMVTSSMWLLHRNFSARNLLFQRAVTAQVLITDKSIDVFRMVEKNLPIIRRLVNSRMSDEQLDQMSSILDDLIKVCHLENNPTEPHPMNQSILCNNGILQEILDLVTQDVDEQMLSQNSGQMIVIEKSFQLLRLLAVANPKVQRRLFDRLDSLLDVKAAETYLAEALTEVFTGNKTTCMKILPAQIRAVMDLVAEYTDKVPQFLELLNAVVKVEELNLPLKRNQAYVMKYFMQLRSKIAYPLDVEMDKIRQQLGGKKRDNETMYIISLINLLATCAEGENRYIESINQTIFTYMDLLKILNDPKICNHYKKSFMRFLLWVYLNTAGGLAESGASEMAHNSDVWTLFENLIEEVKRIEKFAVDHPDELKLLLRKEPTTRESLNVEESEVRNVHETLFYFFDGVLPFMQVFFQTCFEKDLQEHAQELEILKNLTASLVDASKTILPMMDSPTNIDRLIGAIRAMLSEAEFPKEKIEEFQEITNKIFIEDIESDDRKEYNDYFSAEEELNKQLNVYAANFKTVYGGENTVEAQIGFDSSDPYTEIGSDVELPLGEEFQLHIACFVDDHVRDFNDAYRMTSKLVEQLKISSNRTPTNEKARQEQEDLDLKCLQLLRGIVHNAKVRLPCDDDSVNLLSKSYQSRMEILRKVQVAVNSHDAILHVLPLLSKPSDDIVREVLAFLADMLYGGNIDVQASLYAYFSGTREERFFFAIRNRMQLSSVAYKEKRILLAQHQARLDMVKEQMKNLQRALENGQRMGNGLSQVALQLGGSMASTESLGRMLGNNMNLGSRAGSEPGFHKAVTGIMVPKENRVSPMDIPEDDDMDVSRVDLENGMDDIEEERSIGELPSDLDFKDDGYVELVLRVLAYMCDGQNQSLQNYLREQPDNIKSVNVIAEVPKFLSVIYTTINSNSLPLLVQVFETLVEFGSGNQANQVVIYENKICDYINFILRSQKQMSQCDIAGEYKLKLAIGHLIFVLIEENVCEPSAYHLQGNSPEDANVATNMMVSLDADVIKNTFVLVHKLIKENKNSKSRTLSPETLDLLTTVGFRYFHILLRLMDLDFDKTKLTKENLLRGNLQEEVDAWRYFEKQTKSVEILKDNVLQKVYFCVNDESILRQEVKDMFKYEVDRTSPSTKLRDLVCWSKEIIEDIKYQRKVTSNFLGAFLVRGWFSFNYLAILLSVIIAIVILVSWTGDAKSSTTILPVRASWSVFTTLVLGILHNIVSFFILISFFLCNHVRLPTRIGVKSTLTKIFTFGFYEVEEEKESHLGVSLFSFSTLYYVIFFGLSIGGSFTYGYLFAFHLLHIAGFNQLLKRVIQAVTRNGMSLIWVGLYSLTVFYIYGLISFAFFRGQILEPDGNYCGYMWRCFITVIHRGLVFGLYDDSYLSKPISFAYSWHLGKFFFDLTSFIILTTIGLNIIFGIIVDTFSELRDSKWNIDHDIATACFICSRSSHDFEHHPGGFENHVREEHNEWAYLFYFIHLDETHHNDYTGIEMFVADSFVRDLIDFFPVNRSLSLQMSEEDTVEVRLDNLQAQIEFLVAKKKEREVLKVREEELRRQQEWEKMHRGGGGGDGGKKK